MDSKWKTIFTQSKPAPETSTKKKQHKAPAEKFYVCLTCLKSDKPPQNCKISRNNPSTIGRHDKRNHTDGSKSWVVESDASIAKEYMKKLTEKEPSRKRAGHSSATDDDGKPNETIAERGAGAIDLIEDDVDEGDDSRRKELREEPPLKKKSFFERTATPTATVMETDKTQSFLSFTQDKADKEDPTMKDVMNMLDKIYVSVKGKQEINADDAIKNVACDPDIKKYDFKKLSNIYELVAEVDDMVFIPVDDDEVSQSKGAILRCETCYTYISATRPGTRKAAISTSEHASRFSGTLASGIILDKEHSLDVITGGTSYFYRTKNLVLTHVSCSGDGAKIHYEAVKWKKEMKLIELRASAAMKVLVRSAFSVVKSRSAAQQYPEFVADKAMCGVDCGDFGHSKEEFKNILAAAESWIDSEVSRALKTPIESTGMRPHFFFTLDKGTPGRETNQATMIVFFDKGNRVAIPVGSPAVYKPNKDNSQVVGGKAEELAADAIHLIKKRYMLEEEDLSYCQGIVADGQYQSAGFWAELTRQLPFEFDQLPTLKTFFGVLWDPGHFSNLAFTDIRDGKRGDSKQFISRLIKRTNVFGTLFHSGKHLAEMHMVAKSLGVRAHLVKSYSVTRFTSSSYSLFESIIEGYSTYIKAFREHQHDEVKEYMISGYDFIIDLCSVADVMRPFVKMMVLLQSLQYPCWKVVPWWNKVHNYLLGVHELFDIDDCHGCPTLREHIGSIEDMAFKGEKLTEGWLISDVRRAQPEDENEVGTPTVTWNMREADDCVNDIKTFAKDLADSMDNRYQDVHAFLENLHGAFDLEKLFSHLTGERASNGKVNLDERALEKLGRNEYSDFCNFVCLLPHVKKAIQENDLEFDEELSHVYHRQFKQGIKNVMWSASYEASKDIGSWFLVKVPQKSERLVKYVPISSLFHNFRVDKFKLDDEADDANLHTSFCINITESHDMLNVIINEEAIIKTLYTNSKIAQSVGRQFMVTLDVALAKGGPEAIVESYYSCMDAQKMKGGQSTDSVSARAKISWCLPNAMQNERAVTEVAKEFLKRHKKPVIGGKKRAKYSQTLDRMLSEKPKISFFK